MSLDEYLAIVAEVIERELRPLLPLPYQINIVAFQPGRPERDILVGRSTLRGLRAVLDRLETPPVLIKEPGFEEAPDGLAE